MAKKLCDLRQHDGDSTGNTDESQSSFCILFLDMLIGEKIMMQEIGLQ